MKFTIRINGEMEADDIDDCLEQLADHFKNESICDLGTSFASRYSFIGEIDIRPKE